MAWSGQYCPWQTQIAQIALARLQDLFLTSTRKASGIMKFPGFRRASYDQLNSEHGDDEEDLKQLSAKDNAASQNGGRRNLLTIVICLTVGAIVGFFVGSLHGLVVRRTNALGTVTSQGEVPILRSAHSY